MPPRIVTGIKQQHQKKIIFAMSDSQSIKNCKQEIMTCSKVGSYQNQL
jgi:hypothetical protein